MKVPTKSPSKARNPEDSTSPKYRKLVRLVRESYGQPYRTLSKEDAVKAIRRIRTGEP